MIDYTEVRAALVLANALPDTGPFKVAEGLQIVRRLGELGPKHVQPLVHYAENAIMTAKDNPGEINDAYARYYLARLVVEMEVLVRFAK